MQGVLYNVSLYYVMSDVSYSVNCFGSFQMTNVISNVLYNVGRSMQFQLCYTFSEELHNFRCAL